MLRLSFIILGNCLTRCSLDRAKFLLFAYSIILIYFRNKVNRCVENITKVKVQNKEIVS